LNGNVGQLVIKRCARLAMSFAPCTFSTCEVIEAEPEVMEAVDCQGNYANTVDCFKERIH
jgi:hypothetical protein